MTSRPNYPKPTSLGVSSRMRRIDAKDTKPELIVRKLVHGMGYRYRLHRADLPGKPDLVFPARRKVIFVHGCFWHRHNCRAGKINPSVNTSYWQPKLERNRQRDEENLAALRASGWNTLVVWECQIKKAGGLATRIQKFLDNSSCRKDK